MNTMLKVMLTAGAAGSLLAQDQVTQAQRRVVIDQQQLSAVHGGFGANTFEFVAGGLVSGAPIKGAPYSAEAVTETTQVLSDGNRIVQRTSSKQYRDSEGRERQEETSAMGAIFIKDPVAQASFTLHPETRTAEKGPFLNGGASTFYFFNAGDTALPPPPPPPPPPPTGAGTGRSGGGGGVIALGGARSGGPPVATAVRIATPATNQNVKEEQLGTTQMEGVVAQGTRTTTTIPAGQIGNDRPINVVYERWYSPDLQKTVMTKLNDPRNGETVYKLTNVVRVDQPRSLFEIPSDYTVGRGKLGVATYTVRDPRQ